MICCFTNNCLLLIIFISREKCTSVLSLHLIVKITSIVICCTNNNCLFLIIFVPREKILIMYCMVMNALMTIFTAQPSSDRLIVFVPSCGSNRPSLRTSTAADRDDCYRDHPRWLLSRSSPIVVIVIITDCCDRDNHRWLLSRSSNCHCVQAITGCHLLLLKSIQPPQCEVEGEII